jgi:polar amino acid transport system substrate-binding protein
VPTREGADAGGVDVEGGVAVLTRPRSRGATVPVVLATTALVLTACGGSSGSSSSGGGSASSSALPSVSADEALAARVPDSVKADGVITVGSDTSYAPNEYIAEDGTTIVGWDVDLFTLVAKKLGLKAEFQTADFGSIIAGVGSQKYEVGVSSFTINPEREAQVNMVSYYSAGTQWATKKDNPKNIAQDNACGTNIAVQRATVQTDDVTARSQACTAAGKPEITIDQYDLQTDATAAVVSGKDDAVVADSPVVRYAVKQTNGQLDLLGDIYDSAPYGYVVQKEQADFAQAVADAVKALIDDGSYQKVLEQWGVEVGAIDDPTVNPPAQ